MDNPTSPLSRRTPGTSDIVKFSHPFRTFFSEISIFPTNDDNNINKTMNNCVRRIESSKSNPDSQLLS